METPIWRQRYIDEDKIQQDSDICAAVHFRKFDHFLRKSK